MTTAMKTMNETNKPVWKPRVAPRISLGQGVVGHPPPVWLYTPPLSLPLPLSLSSPLLMLKPVPVLLPPPRDDSLLAAVSTTQFWKQVVSNGSTWKKEEKKNIHIILNESAPSWTSNNVLWKEKKKEKRKNKNEKRKKEEAYVRIGNETHQHRRHRVAKNVISKHAEGGCNRATFFRDWGQANSR